MAGAEWWRGRDVEDKSEEVAQEQMMWPLVDRDVYILFRMECFQQMNDMI